MRFILGIVLGALLTISVVYVYDARTAATTEGQPMVNWQVVSRNWDAVTDRARIELERLGTRARDEWNRHVG